MSRFAAALLKPTGKWARVSMWSIMVLGILGPGMLLPSNNATIIWMLLWALFMFVCWLRATMRRLVVWRYWQPKEKLRVDDNFRRTSRIAFVFTALLLLLPLSMRPTVLLSRPWLDRLAYYWWDEAPCYVEPPKQLRLCGLIFVTDVETSARNVTPHLLWRRNDQIRGYSRAAKTPVLLVQP